MSQFKPGELGMLVSRRAALMSEMLEKLGATVPEEQELLTRLIAAAPDSLRGWVEESGMLSHLAKYGTISDKIYFIWSDYPDLQKLKTPAEVRAAIGDLNKAWKGVVLVTIQSMSENGVADLRIVAPMFP